MKMPLSFGQYADKSWVKEELAAAKTPEEAADTIRKYEIRIK